MKASEYGGSDTDKTQGIQPFPHLPTAEEKLRLIYGQDAMEPETLVADELGSFEIE